MLFDVSVIGAYNKRDRRVPKRLSLCSFYFPPSIFYNPAFASNPSIALIVIG